MPFVVKPGQTVLFIGDSITDCGRRAAEAPLGAGYVRQARDLMLARYPKHKVNVINKGIGGNTVRDLANRWSDDVIPFKPDWLSVKIGINDLHTWLRNDPDRGVSPEQFAELYDHILTRTRKETKAKLILMDPFYISNDRDPMSFRCEVLKQLPKYIKVVEKMASKHKARRVKTHQLYTEAIKYCPADQLAPEPVHPYPGGHLIMAHGWLKAMGW